MSSGSEPPMSPEDRARYGAAIAKNAAFDAVQELWRRRCEEHWTRKKAAESIGRDEGWFSKQFTGPRNWTMETFGALIQSLNGEVEIVVRPIEEASRRGGKNFDAYAELEDDLIRRSSVIAPPKDHLTPAEGTQRTIKFEKFFRAQ